MKNQVQLCLLAIAFLVLFTEMHRNRTEFGMLLVNRQWVTTPLVALQVANIYEENKPRVSSTHVEGLKEWDSIMASGILTVTRNTISRSKENATIGNEILSCNPFDLINNTGRWLKHHNELSRTAEIAPADLDVLFLGDSIVEHWNGTKFLGKGLRPDNREAFLERFSKARGAKLEGLAFGAAGDHTQNLNWRIKNGLLPDSINPKVIWILIGTNNFFTDCSTSENVLTAIIEAARHAHQRKPLAKIVIQGLLPRGDIMGSFELGRAWKSIQGTNRRLSAICDKFPKLHYFEFDSSKFLRWYRLRKIVNADVLRDGVHPSSAGYTMMGSRIETEVLRLISKQ